MMAAHPFVRAGSAWALLTVVLVTTSVACTASGTSDDDGDSASSCAYRVEYENRTYTGAEAKGFAPGDKLGTATLPACDDTPDDDNDGQATPTSTTAYAIKGVDPGIAIALKESSDDVIFINLDSDTELPEIKKLIQGP
ncbi:hypothetical protein CW362_19385 [Streptomyces populi]|uniref:Secreted protein n=1 Tax=Streptomyces populi TaxID=2058924 RepID=A0A2I0SN56_9ACTN|nr:DUF6281 family protein [Streptomyces populi]PKT71368.1 hypothetical protein CW362_19385 [Streptomyces populi]